MRFFVRALPLNLLPFFPLIYRPDLGQNRNAHVSSPSCAGLFFPLGPLRKNVGFFVMGREGLPLETSVFFFFSREWIPLPFLEEEDPMRSFGAIFDCFFFTAHSILRWTETSLLSPSCPDFFDIEMMDQYEFSTGGESSYSFK